MSTRRYHQTIARLRDGEQPEAVLLVAADRDYVSILAAWLRCEVRAKVRATGSRGPTEAEMWQWLWRNTCFSKEALRKASGVPAKRFEAKLETLIANRVIYPDGSVNSFVRRYLRERVLRLLGVDGSSRRSLRPPVAPTSDPDA